jgi:hypothetical protein
MFSNYPIGASILLCHILVLISCKKDVPTVETYPQVYSLGKSEFGEIKGYVLTGSQSFKEIFNTTLELYSTYAVDLRDDAISEVKQFQRFDKIERLNDSEARVSNDISGSLDSGINVILPYSSTNDEISIGVPQNTPAVYFKINNGVTLESRMLFVMHKAKDEPNNDFLNYGIRDTRTLNNVDALKQQLTEFNYGIGDTLYVFTFKSDFDRQ